jgi:SAM-dependent methyltransferase
MPDAAACARDPWLDRWLPRLRDAAAARPVLELGCDTGVDTAWLLRQGFAVTATDISADALAQSALNAPGALHVRHDLQQPMPFADATFGAVLASLCLHYFAWQATLDAVAQIRRCLAPGGLLLCRLNSTADVHHGATGFEEIEPNFYRVHARYSENKRFFDRAAVEALFAQGWEFINLEELTNHRYTQPKVAWEAVLKAI